MTTRCAIYCRVSSDRQREARTIESQRDALNTHAAGQDGWLVVAREEDDGVSGSVAPWERPGMRRVLELVRRNEIDVLLVLSIDRISRDPDNIHFNVVRRNLRDHAVKLATPAGVLDGDSPTQRLLQDVLSGIATFERSMITERTTRGRDRAILSGGRPPNRLPLGYGWSLEAGTIVAEEREAAVVREVFRLAAEEGLTLRAIDRALRRTGMRSGRQTAGKEAFLAVSSIRRVVERSTYWTGDYKPYAKRLPEHVREVPVLVAESTWRAANETLKRTRGRSERKRGFPFLLVGLVRCALCGRNMRAQTAKGKHAYYRCEHASKPQGHEGRCTSNKAVRAEETDELVWGVVSKLINEPGALQAEVQRMVADELEASGGEPPDAILRRARRELERLDGARRRVVGLFRDGLIERPELESHLEEIDQQREPWLRRQQLMVVKKETDDQRALRARSVELRLASMRSVVDELDPVERRKVVREIVDEVVIDGLARSVEVRGIFLVGGALASGGGTGQGPLTGAGTAPVSEVDCSSASPARARSWLRGACTTRALARPGPLCR